MTWSAIIPLKAAGTRKSRLAAQLSAVERDALALAMFAHVADALEGCALIGQVWVLAPSRPEGWRGAWLPDQGGGLNAELAAGRRRLGGSRILLIHADLPCLSSADVAALVQAAETTGAALAADRHDRGTNAIALRDAAAATFHFGRDSLRRHRAQWPEAAVLRRDGLARDLDTLDDLREMARQPIGRRPAGRETGGATPPPPA